MTALTELEQLAKAATPGPWRQSEHEHLKDCIMTHGSNPVIYCDEVPIMELKDAAFIAAANPQVILRLIELVREMAGALDDMTRTCPKQAGCNDFHHFAGQRHSFDEDCPPTQAYFDAINRADVALEKYRGMTK